MSEPSEHTAPQVALPPEVLELLAAVRDALDVTGLDRDALIQRMVSVRVYLGTVLSGVAVDAKFPDLPPRTAERIAQAADLLREL